MTPLEILAAKIRGAETNAEGATIIADWYLLQTRSAANLARESAAIVRKGAGDDGILSPLTNQVASNFESIVTMLAQPKE